MDSELQLAEFRKVEALESSAIIDALEWEGLNLWTFFRSESLGKVLNGPDTSVYDPAFHQQAPARMARMKLKRRLKRLRGHLSDAMSNHAPAPGRFWLFTEDDAFYRDQVSGGWYNRHLDPYYEAFERLGEPVQKVRIFNAKSRIQTTHPGVVLLPELLAEWNDLNWLSRELRSFRPSKAMQEVAQRLNVSLAKVMNSASKVLAALPLFEQLLDAARPKAIGLVNYHTPTVQALLVAARKKGIPTFDLQHGKQGDLNFSYSHFSYPISKGYDCMPDGFWNWNLQSAQNIIGKSQVASTRLRAAVGGNLWLEKCLQEEMVDLSREEAEVLQRARMAEKSFLFCAQPLKDFVLPGFLQDYIREHPESFFGIRLHPRQKMRDYAELLALETLPNVEIKYSSSAFLYEAIKAFDHVITRWSTVALEALVFEKHVILVDRFGLEAFSDFVERGDMFGALSAEEFDQALAKTTDGPSAMDHVSVRLNDAQLRAGLDFLIGPKTEQSLWTAEKIEQA